MRRLIFFLAASVLAQDVTFTVDSKLVVVNVMVRDKAGRVVTNLKKEDFRIFEDNVQQTIASFDLQELNGERIDIVPWSSDPERFARLALEPAKVARVFSDQATKTIQAIVDEDQLSLAIGRNGQNVRLASELTEWKIDLYSSREWLERGGDEEMRASGFDPDQALDVTRAVEPGAERVRRRRVTVAGGDHLEALAQADRELAGIERIPGAHCYEFFAGPEAFAALADEEPGSFYLTDFLAKAFDRLVWEGLGLDRHRDDLKSVAVAMKLE